MDSLFIYDFTVAGGVITPVSYRRVNLHTAAGSQFPPSGTFGSHWLAKTQNGQPVIYASLNANAFTNGTAGVTQAGYPAGTVFRIENIESATPTARPESLLSNVANGGDGYNCSEASAMWLLEVADDVNYTPINTPVTGNWISNDNLYAAELKVTSGTSVTGATTQGGAITVNRDGTYTYTPAAGFTGVDTYDYTVCDNFAGGGTECRTATITIYVGGPVGNGQDDSERTPIGTPVTLNVLANDAFPKPANPVVTTTAPANGTVTVGAGGNVTYTPAPNFTGVDTFTYTTTDSNGVPHTQTVTVVVGPLGAAPDRYTASEGTPFTTGPITTTPGNSTPLDKLTPPAGNDT